MARTGEVAAALRQAERNPAALTDDQAIALLPLTGTTWTRWRGSPTGCAAR